MVIQDYILIKKRLQGQLLQLKQQLGKEGFTTGMDNAIIDKSKGVEHFSDGIRYICEYLYPIGKHKPQLIRDRSWSF
jgi:hypothetical protein